MPDRQRQLLLSLRQALLIALGAIEDYLDIPRSVQPRHKRHYVDNGVSIR